MEANSFDNSKSLARRNTFWNPPGNGWFKLNFDGATKGNPGMANIGGIIRACKGNFVAGFVGGIGIQSSMTVESRVLLKGVELPVTLGIKNLHSWSFSWLEHYGYPARHKLIDLKIGKEIFVSHLS